MSANRDLIQGLYDAFARGDAAHVLGCLHADVRWMEAEGGPLADRNPYTNPMAVGEGVFGRILAVFDGFSARPESLVAGDDTVLAQGRYGGTNKESGAVLDAQFAHVWTIRDGKVSQFQQYTDTHQWLQAMGSA